jgi:hypothetical protein
VAEGSGMTGSAQQQAPAKSGAGGTTAGMGATAAAGNGAMSSAPPADAMQGAEGGSAAGRSAPDPDHTPVCGNGVIEADETCDPIDSCPTAEGCRGTGSTCLRGTLVGDPTKCTAACESETITACSTGDACCPSGCTFASDEDCSKSCGDGHVDASETCEPPSADQACPTSCDDGDACTKDSMTGSAAQCNVECVNAPIKTPSGGDGCCPEGANANNDRDCSPKCGNRVKEEGEFCDGDCPTSCDDDDDCTADSVAGTASTCNVECMHRPIARPANNDRCCPEGANANNDSDCSASCGNGVLEDGELCDGDCPTSCADDDPCTMDRVVGNARTCNAQCQNNPISRTGPSTCMSNDPCIKVERVLSETSCTAACRPTTITQRQNNDECCPSGATAATDNDCEPDCGNGVVEAGEECETGARSTGSGGLPSGTVYDEWSCDGATCKRRFDLTPCGSSAECGSSATCGRAGNCMPMCDSSVPLRPDPVSCGTPGTNCWNCELSNGQHGLCISGNVCLLKCSTDRDCPFGLSCKAYDECGDFMVCDPTGALLDPQQCP